MMLSVEALKIRYGEVEAVRRVDLAVDSGEIIALVGANGAGKSSTLGAIAGLVPAAAGSGASSTVSTSPAWRRRRSPARASRWCRKAGAYSPA